MMQTKVTDLKLCPECEIHMTNHTIEVKTTSGKVLSVPCCIPCRPKMERRLRNARMDVMGIDRDEDDEIEAEMLKIPTRRLDSVIADKEARRHQEVRGRERYVDAGTVSPKKVSQQAPVNKAKVTALMALIKGVRV